MKRILTIQDISCLGKCSITIALPVLSAMGIETVILPTALLSNHTLFPEYTKLDLEDQMMPTALMWKKNGVHFDAIYTGYLGSVTEIEKTAAIIDLFREKDTIVFVDPVMGDHGRLYAGFTPEYVRRMACFCSKGDVIVPNITEACLMLEMEYIGDSYTESDLRQILAGLTRLGADKAVLTGVSMEPGRLGAAGYDGKSGEYFLCMGDRVEGTFHGTGDIFASVCVGALAKGDCLRQAVETAVGFTAESIRRTAGEQRDRRFGVNFEQALPLLTDGGNSLEFMK